MSQYSKEDVLEAGKLIGEALVALTDASERGDFEYVVAKSVVLNGAFEEMKAMTTEIAQVAAMAVLIQREQTKNAAKGQTAPVNLEVN